MLLPMVQVERQPFPGPGLAIRVICTTEPYFGSGFERTNALLRFLSHGDAGTLSAGDVASAKKMKSENTSALSALGSFAATTLPIRTVQVCPWYANGGCASVRFPVVEGRA